MEQRDLFKYIDMFRENNEVSIQKLCSNVGITPKSYHNYKNNERVVPFDVLSKICNEFGYEITIQLI